ncbi:MAG: ABC transporter permease [Abditibacteriales bacterium]|nr:ABC transporter permease [Abditibacteriales bacterium]
MWQWENPVLMREMRSRMRSGRAYWTILAYVFFLCIAFAICYVEWRRSNNDVRQWHRLGQEYFRVMVIMQTILGALLAPALTSGALTLEREQRTWEMLCMTLMKPRSILFGKLTSALSYVVLLAFSSMPLVGLCFMFGGVSAGEFLAAYAVILGSTFFFGIVGMFASSLFRKTMTATAIAYLITLFFTVGTVFLEILVWEVWRVRMNSIGIGFLYLNPIVAVVSTFENIRMAWSIGLPFVVTTLLCYALLSLLMLTIAVRSIRP